MRAFREAGVACSPLLNTATLTLALLLLSACDQAPRPDSDYPTVYAQIETAPVSSTGDAADDPAIWVNVDDPTASRILGTDKKRGLGVYDLEGNELQMIERGNLNNVDLRQAVPLDGRETTIAAATNRSETSLDIFEVSANGRVTFVRAQPLTMEEPYGLCMMLDGNGNASVFANDKNGAYQHWQVIRDGRMDVRLLGEFALSSKPEGCVVDDSSAILYAGEEERGVWMLPADTARAEEKRLIDHTGGGRLVADVEGMAIYRATDEISYLVVSSQGDHSYAVYQIDDSHGFRGSFRVFDHPELAIDGTEQTDGIDITSTALGSAFPKGLLVVQDGFNRNPKENQNFKLIDWRQVSEVLGLESSVAGGVRSL